MKLIPSCLALLFVAIFISCADVDPGASEINALPIDTYLERETIKNRPHLKINNSALSRDFMLYGNFIPMLNSPTGYSLKSRIVRFEALADRVIMLESPVGHSLADHNESTILLAEFPLVQQESDGVVIDFAKGMNAAFTMRNVHSRAVSDSEPGTAEQFKAVLLSASFIRSIEIDNNVLTISQIAQWRNRKSELLSAEFRYFLREYTPSPDFQKTTFGKNRWLQYFSTPPMVKAPTTKTFAYITKWDLKNPIVFYLSANTPVEYRQPIKDGLLFWNHIFDKEVVRVLDLEPGIFAPHPRLNIVQWVPWDNEASAYADIVIDNLTGQTLQAQIYIRSGWVIQSAKKLKTQREELLINKPENKLPSIEEDVPMPLVFETEKPCMMSMGDSDSLTEFREILAKGDFSDSSLTTMTGDILRTVVAHEMGHIFGLRHNLAGSLSGTISEANHLDILKQYLNDTSFHPPADTYLSSSIMDVFSAADDALMGAQIRGILAKESSSHGALARIFAHDKLAIDVGYFNKPITGSIPFCSDDDLAIYIDCKKWDVGNQPLLFSSNRLNNIMNQIVLLLADTFMMALDPNRPGGPLLIKDIFLTNVLVQKVVDQYARDLLSWFNDKARSIQIEAQYPALGPHNQSEITKARFLSMRQQMKESPEKTLFGLLPPFRSEQLSDTVLTTHFISQLQKRMTESNQTLSQSDLEEARTLAQTFFAKLNQDIISLILTIVAKAQFDDPDYQLPIEQALGRIAKEIIFAEIKGENTLPQFVYDQKTRQSVVHILSPALGLLPDWSYESLQEVGFRLKQLMKSHGASGGSPFDLDKMSRPQRQWLLEQNRIYDALMSVRNSARSVPH